MSSRGNWIPIFLVLLCLFSYSIGSVPSPASGEIAVPKAVPSDHGPDPPEWVKNAVFYQIMVDRFRNGDPTNDPQGDGDSGDLLMKSVMTPGGDTYPILFAKKMDWTDDVEYGVSPWGPEPWCPHVGRAYFGGDFQGVKEKIPYLKELGVNAIYFNPIHHGPHDHGYSVEDYKSVNAYFSRLEREDLDGYTIARPAADSLDIFEDLMEALDHNGIRVILDGVFNDCSSTSIYFDRDAKYGVTGAYESQESPWFEWFSFIHWPNDYERWQGMWHLPNLEEVESFKGYLFGSPEPEQQTSPDPSKSVIEFWNDLGVDGWRLDLAMLISWDFWREFSEAYKNINPEGYLVAEPDHSGTSPRYQYISEGNLDAIMNYPWRNAIIDWVNGGSPSLLDGILTNLREALPNDEYLYVQLNMFGTHDDHRILTEVGGDKDRAKLAVIFQMTYPGAPCIWYGEEVGMTSDYPRGSGTKQRADPHTRRAYPWMDEGYPVPEQPDVPDMDMFEHYKKLIGIRMKYPVLRTGSLETLKVDDDQDIYALGREHDGTYAVLIYNNGESQRNVDLDLSGFVSSGSVLYDVLNGNEEYTVEGSITVSVDPMWACILVSDISGVSEITLVVPSTVSSRWIQVSGTAPPGELVKIYVNDELVESARADGAGNYSTYVRLDKGTNVVRAEVLGASTEKTVTYSAEEEGAEIPWTIYGMAAVIAVIGLVLILAHLLRRR